MRPGPILNNSSRNAGTTWSAACKRSNSAKTSPKQCSPVSRSKSSSPHGPFSMLVGQRWPTLSFDNRGTLCLSKSRTGLRKSITVPSRFMLNSMVSSKSRMQSRKSATRTNRLRPKGELNGPNSGFGSAQPFQFNVVSRSALDLDQLRSLAQYGFRSPKG